MSSISPKKKFGQNFLKNSDTALQIVNFLELKNCKTILEIGPGMGALTKHILNINEFEKIFIEVDNECCDYLENILPEIEGKIINVDFLKYNLSSLENPIAVIGNFPYNISSQILFRIIENLESISEMVGMFQYEVAERISSAFCLGSALKRTLKISAPPSPISWPQGARRCLTQKYHLQLVYLNILLKQPEYLYFLPHQLRLLKYQ